MTDIFSSTDAWIPSLVLAAAMLAAWRAGVARGRWLRRQDAEVSGDEFEGASMALLGLLLAFTFSLALAKYDHRREALVTDANAIGDFYTCATLLPDPARAALQDLLRTYVERRLEIARRPPEALTPEILKSFTDMHGRMTELVAGALRDGTPIAVPLTNTLNGLTSSHASRLAAVRDRLPWVVVLLLLFAATVTTGLIGERQGAKGRKEVVGTLCFILLVALVVYVTLDLNQPSRGLIRVSQEPLEQLLATMTH